MEQAVLMGKAIRMKIVDSLQLESLISFHCHRRSRSGDKQKTVGVTKLKVSSKTGKITLNIKPKNSLAIKKT